MAHWKEHVDLRQFQKSFRPDIYSQHSKCRIVPDKMAGSQTDLNAGQILQLILGGGGDQTHPVALVLISGVQIPVRAAVTPKHLSAEGACQLSCPVLSRQRSAPTPRPKTCNGGNLSPVLSCPGTSLHRCPAGTAGIRKVILMALPLPSSSKT